MKKRFVKDIPLNVPAEDVERLIKGFLSGYGFYRTDWNGEPCWALDRAVFCEKYQMFLYSYENGILHIEAWLRSGKTGEDNLSGWAAMSDKKSYLELIMHLIGQVLALLPQGSNVRVEDVLSDEDKKTVRWYKIVWPLVVIAALILLILPQFFY